MNPSEAYNGTLTAEQFLFYEMRIMAKQYLKGQPIEEMVKIVKQQKKLTAQAQEIAKFEEKVHHLADMNIEIDLDDGVKRNYEKFAYVLGKI
jgi:hypothetical protein